MSYTPGPWKWGDDCIVGAGGAKVLWNRYDQKRGGLLSASDSDERLILAAPVLLAACLAVQRALPDLESGMSLHADADYRVNSALNDVVMAVITATVKLPENAWHG